MSYRLLLDENIEHEVLHRLKSSGHDVEHVDFIEDIPSNQYRAALFFEDDTMSAKEVTNIVHTMSNVYPHEDVSGLQKTGREWL